MKTQNGTTNLLANRDAAPFDNADLRRAMALALDRKSFVEILSDGKAKIGGAMLPPPEGLWGMPTDMLETLPGYGPDVQKNRAGEIEGAVIASPGEPFESAFDEPLQAIGEVVTAEKLATVHFIARQVLDLRHLFDEAVAGDSSAWSAKYVYHLDRHDRPAVMRLSEPI